MGHGLPNIKPRKLLGTLKFLRSWKAYGSFSICRKCLYTWVCLQVESFYKDNKLAKPAKVKKPIPSPGWFGTEEFKKWVLEEELRRNGNMDKQKRGASHHWETYLGLEAFNSKADGFPTTLSCILSATISTWGPSTWFHSIGIFVRTCASHELGEEWW